MSRKVFDQIAEGLREAITAARSEPSSTDRATAVPSNKKGGRPEPSAKEFSMLDIREKAPKAKILQKVGSEFVVASPDARAADWLDQQIARSKDGVITQVVELTPALARVLLHRNPDNRSVSPLTVEKYARDMTNSAWAFNGEPIIISRDGHLNDGQHRCEAVLLSERTIQAILVIGTERSSRFTVDQGKTRSAGDFLGMNGQTDSVALAAATKYIWQHQNFGRLSHHSQMSPTKSEVLMLVETTPTIIESLKRIQSKGSDSVGGRSILTFAHWTFTRLSGERSHADVFMDALINGSNLGIRSPILYARNRLMAERGRLKANEKAELIIRAWNAHRRGDKVASLPVKGGALPSVER